MHGGTKLYIATTTLELIHVCNNIQMNNELIRSHGYSSLKNIRLLR